MAETIEIKPQPGKQTEFLSSPADIVIYGGSAGGGKSWGLLLEPLRHIHNPKFGAVAFRRTFPQIMNEGGLWDKAMELYPLLGGKPNKVDVRWRFPSGAKITFSHLQHESDVLQWQGSEVPLFLWDELTHFTRYQFFYMMSRSRSTSGVIPYHRAGCNPDADSWVAKLIEWWIDQDTGFAIQERSGVLRWFYVVDDVVMWYDTSELAQAANPELAGIAPPKSLTFISASVYDNPALLKKDPGYLANLLALPLVERERLLGGNWKVRPEAGKVFNRDWFEIVETVPTGGVECRFWDFAATEKKMKGDDPDYTAGVKIVKVGAIYYVVDSIAVRKSTADVDKLVSDTAANDRTVAGDRRREYFVRWEIEPGSSGKNESYRRVTALDSFDAAGRISTGDKLSRASAFAAQAMIGNVKLLKGAWNEAWLTHMHHQPDYAHDDTMDASAGAYNAIVAKTKERPEETFTTIRTHR